MKALKDAHRNLDDASCVIHLSHPQRLAFEIGTDSCPLTGMKLIPGGSNSGLRPAVIGILCVGWLTVRKSAVGETFADDLAQGSEYRMGSVET